MPFRPSELMSKKIALLMFTMFVILASFVVMTVPQANALINRDYTIRNPTHNTASTVMHSVVCGNHICLPGQKTGWEKSMFESHSMNSGKPVATHGTVVMQKMTGKTEQKTTSENMIPMNSMRMTTNGTENAVMTGNTTTGTK